MARNVVVQPRTDDPSHVPAPVWIFANAVGDVTADVTVKAVAPFDGRFEDLNLIVGTVGTTGADGTDPLFIEFDVLKNGVTIFSTKPRIDDAAANGSDLPGSGTPVAGVTAGVFAAEALRTFAKNDVLSVVIDVTRTTPETEAADAHMAVGLTPIQSKDTAITANVTS